MAPAAAVAFSILVSIGFAGQALPLAVLLAMVACVLVANSIGQLAKHMPSAGGLYTYNSRALGPYAGFMTGWVFLLFEPLIAPLLFLIFAWATEDVVKNEIGWDIGWAWWVLVAAGIVFFLTYRDVRLSTRSSSASSRSPSSAPSLCGCSSPTWATSTFRPSTPTTGIRMRRATSPGSSRG
jgi:amino acid transporter